MTTLRGIGAVAAVLLAVVACTTPAHLRPIPPRGPVPADSRIPIETAPVPLDPGDPARREIDGFHYAGGLALTSSATSRLHGLSDLWIAPDGTFVSPTDDGDLVTARILLGPDGQFVGVGGAALTPLLGVEGQPLQGKTEGDAEGLIRLADGTFLVSFERDHRIWAYDRSGKPRPVVMPDATFADNEGMEGLAAAPSVGDGAFWVGSEPGAIWLCRLEVSCEAVPGLPVPPFGYRLSSLTVGPGGELVILHHSFIPAIGSRIILSIVSNPLGSKTVIGRLAMGPSTTVDNFEGVAVVPGADGTWRLYLLSDDNFNDKQRTILLAFDWTPPK